MNKAEFAQVSKLAFDRPLALLPDDTEALHGCALPGFAAPATVTYATAAALLRYQCLQFDGGIDQNELNEMASIYRRKVYVV